MGQKGRPTDSGTGRQIARQWEREADQQKVGQEGSPPDSELGKVDNQTLRQEN
jgi:hypothetical protein